MESIPIRMEDLDYRQFTGNELLTNLFGISSQALIQIYYFYKKTNHKKDVMYKLEIDFESALGKLYERSEYNVYRQFGIYIDISYYVPNELEVDWLVIMPISVLSNEEALKNFVENERSLAKGRTLKCIIERDYNECNADVLQHDYELMYRLYPEIGVLNSGFYRLHRITYSMEKLLRADLAKGPLKKFYTLDVSELFKEFDFTNNMVSNARKACALRDKVVVFVDDYCMKEGILRSDVIIYTDYVLKSDTLKYLWCSLSVYWTMVSGIHCYVDNDLRAVFLSYAKKITSRSYNYLCDYLKMLRNFPNFSVSISKVVASLCIKDLAKLNADLKNKASERKYILKLSVFQIQVDMDNFALSDDFSSEQSIVYYDAIRPCDFRDYFDLTNTDFDVCIKEYRRLNDLISEFSKLLRKNTMVLTNKTLNCTNLLLYRNSAGEYYLAFVNSISYKLPFRISPLTNKYGFLDRDLSVADLDGLYDSRVIFDLDVSIDKIISKIPAYKNNRNFMIDPKNANGCLLSGIVAKPEKFNSNDFLSFSDIGIWSEQTSRMRLGYETAIMRHLNVDEMINNGYFGFFGGIHPAISTLLEISTELWR